VETDFHFLCAETWIVELLWAQVSCLHLRLSAFKKSMQAGCPRSQGEEFTLIVEGKNFRGEEIS